MTSNAPQKFFTTRLHAYTQKDIRVELSQLVYKESKVGLPNLDQEDIDFYKQIKGDDKKFDAYLENKYGYEPPSKKFKPIDKEERSENLKLILSREGETNKFKAQFKSTLNNSKFASTSTTSASTSTTSASTSTTSASTSTTSASTLTTSASTSTTSASTSTTSASTSTTSASTSTTSASTSTTSASTSSFLESTSSASTSSFLESTSSLSISSESTLTHPTPNILANGLSRVEESKKSSNPEPFISKIGPQIRVRDPRTMIDDEITYKRFLYIFDMQSRITQVNGIKKVASTSCASTLIKGKVTISEIERLYKKYFSKKVQNTIVVIANILNIISVSNKHHKARMDESFKKKTEAEKLKERCDANKIHTKHKNVLELELKTNFSNVISLFSESEFETAFQMFFLSILTVLRALDQPKFKKGSMFKNLVLLLWNSLKSCNFEHPLIFPMFRSKSFRPDCIDLISIIENSKHADPEITERMALFFGSAISSREYFRTVIDAVTGNKSEDLESLIKSSMRQCLQNKIFEDTTENVCAVRKMCINNAPAASVQNITKSDGAKNSNGIIQTIQVLNENKVQKTASDTTVELHPASGSIQPLNTYYETFSNSLLTKDSSESISSKVSTLKLNGVSSSPSTSNGSFGQVITFRPKLQTIRHTPKPDGSSTILLGNKEFQLVRSASLSQVKTVNTQGASSIVIRSQQKPVDVRSASLSQVKTENTQGASSIVIRSQQKPVDVRSASLSQVKTENTQGASSIVIISQQNSVDVSAMCCAEDCKNEAKIMCSACEYAKYCNSLCQKKDWYSKHISKCDGLKKTEKNSQ